jgi:hypothetical protein
MANGRMPVREFIDGVKDKKELAQILADISLLGDEGPVLPFPLTSALSSFPGIRELRTRAGGSQYRVLYVISKGEVVLLHAFRKTATSQVRREYEVAADRARRMM